MLAEKLTPAELQESAMIIFQINVIVLERINF